MRCRRRIHSCLLQSAAIIVVTTAAVGSAKAQAANTTGANVNALNLLAPFLTLNATPVGKATLQQSLQTVIAINNGATPAQQQTAVSDALNLMSEVSNKITLPDNSHKYYGPAANLAGGLPAQATVDNITPYQPIGGFGSVLGHIYQTGVDPNSPSPLLADTITLLTTALDFADTPPPNSNFIGSDLNLAKYYSRMEQQAKVARWR